jgi:hypothetical protein
MNKKDNKEFTNYIKIITEALERENFDAYDAAVEMLDEEIKERRHQKELEKQLDTTNFGVLNHIFESRLPELFKTNKAAVRKVIKLIKEDQNLSSEFKFYDTIRKYRGNITETIDPATLLAKFNETAETYKFIDKDTIIESNKKFRKVLKENNIMPTEFLTEEEKKLYDAGHIILTRKKNLNNVVALTESLNSLSNYMEAHKNDVVKESVDPNKLIREFEEKLKDTLTESEISFVQQITDWRSPIAEQRKEKLFNKFKNECIDKINDMLKEDAENVELKDLSDQLSEMKFDKNNIVKDIAKLLEIRDILMDD